MKLTYDFIEDGYEYEADPTISDYAAYLCQAYFSVKGSPFIIERGLTAILTDFDCLSEELDNDDNFKEYMYDICKDRAWEEYQDNRYLKITN